MPVAPPAEEPSSSSDLILEHSGTPASQHGVLPSERERRSIRSLPDDVLVEIFAQLPSASLAAAERVCKAFFRLINNEAAWKRAFWATIASGQSEATAPGWRLQPLSWRREYIQRTRLIA
jgi:hypothetical protein